MADKKMEAMDTLSARLKQAEALTLIMMLSVEEVHFSNDVIGAALWGINELLVQATTALDGVLETRKSEGPRTIRTA